MSGGEYAGAADDDMSTQPDFRLYRVKLYVLAADQAWSDEGTGFVSVDFDEESQCQRMAVVCEADGTTQLFATKIVMDDIYGRQGGPCTQPAYRDAKTNATLTLTPTTYRHWHRHWHSH